MTIYRPEYLRKIIVLDSARNAISIEDDYFKNPRENQDLIISHKYYSGQTTIMLGSDDWSIYISKKQADSLLKVWHIKQNPFSDH